MPNFADTYREIVERYYGPLEKTDGFKEQEIALIETRLGLALPATLKDYYRIAGRLDEINSAHHRLIPLAQLRVTRGLLPFYSENEEVLSWCINTESPMIPDPFVYQLVPDDEEVLEEGGLLSDFFINMFFVQCLNGGLKYGAMATVTNEASTLIADTWQRTDLIRPPYSEDHVVYTLGNSLANLVPSESQDRLTLTVATQVESEFRAIRQQLPVRWLLHTR
jgi:hypothetical protein